jgi:phosphoribosylformylglycinamidine cyclo-ligase
VHRQWTYKKAGVDREAARAALDSTREAIESTFRPEVVGSLGGFGGFFHLPEKYEKPLLVASTDGVGTKVLVAAEAGRYRDIGVDLVAMNVNDILVHGAEPLVFLDYIAVGKLDPRVVEEIIKGVVEGCRQAGCSLIGGETAEMPDLYRPGHLDLAGTAIGVVERDKLITGETILEGYIILGLPSSGLHSNGFSLVRRVLLSENASRALSSTKELGYPLGEELLKPTAIYVRPVRALLESVQVHGLVHITGGGIVENVPRVLPDRCKAVIYKACWSWPSIFRLIQEKGKLEESEMFRTFNMGLGMLVIVPEESVSEAQMVLKRKGMEARVIGRIEARKEGEPSVVLAEEG